MEGVFLQPDPDLGDDGAKTRLPPPPFILHKNSISNRNKLEKLLASTAVDQRSRSPGSTATKLSLTTSPSMFYLVSFLRIVGECPLLPRTSPIQIHCEIVELFKSPKPHIEGRFGGL